MSRPQGSKGTVKCPRCRRSMLPKHLQAHIAIRHSERFKP